MYTLSLQNDISKELSIALNQQISVLNTDIDGIKDYLCEVNNFPGEMSDAEYKKRSAYVRRLAVLERVIKELTILQKRYSMRYN